MYRSYENPFTLQDRLAELKQEYADRISAGESVEDLIDLQCDIAEMEDRINFAWQDDEYDSEYEY